MKSNNEQQPVDDIDISDHADKTCDFCSKASFKTYNEMQAHYRNAHNCNGYTKCCQQKFYDISHYKEHIAWAHINPDVFRYV